LGQTVPPLRARETLGLPCRTGQRRCFGIVPFLEVMCWLRGLCGFQRWWPRRFPTGLCGVSCCSSEAPGRIVRHRSHSAAVSPSLARPCHLLSLRRLSWRMSSGALIQVSSVPIVRMCVVLVVMRSSDSVPASHHSWLEAGLGVRVVDVEGVCCKPKGWCDVVANL
jgi:hypothetical protein